MATRLGFMLGFSEPRPEGVIVAFVLVEGSAHVEGGVLLPNNSNLAVAFVAIMLELDFDPNLFCHVQFLFEGGVMGSRQKIKFLSEKKIVMRVSNKAFTQFSYKRLMPKCLPLLSNKEKEEIIIEEEDL